MKKLTMKEKASLFDALFNQQKIEIVDSECVGSEKYQYIQVKMWTKHLGHLSVDNKTKTERAKKMLSQFLITHHKSLSKE